LLFTVTSTNGFYSPPPMVKSGLKLPYINNVYGNLKSEISQDYIQKPKRNCMFMNSASVYASQRWAVHPQIASPQFCGRKYCVRFADLSQMWQSADFRFANSIFFMISRCVLCILAICRPKIFRFKRKR
jgi:hypothetical protein